MRLSSPEQSDAETIEQALELICTHGADRSIYHKQWLLDQLVRLLAPDYEQWVATFEDAEHDTWGEGVSPTPEAGEEVEHPNLTPWRCCRTASARP